jgi:ABC-type sugar transport system ATPase subunit
MPEPLLTIEGLSAGYGDVRVLWDISLAVEAGEITCIVGSNGAGAGPPRSRYANNAGGGPSPR